MSYTYKYPRPAVTADCIVITREVEPKVLLIQRGDEPFKGAWAFPGGFMNMDVDRDPRGRTLTVAYLAVIEEPVALTGQDDAAKAEWWPLSNLPHLAFDHYDIMQDAIRCYKNAISTRFADSKGAEK